MQCRGWVLALTTLAACAGAALHAWQRTESSLSGVPDAKNPFDPDEIANETAGRVV